MVTQGTEVIEALLWMRERMSDAPLKTTGESTIRAETAGCMRVASLSSVRPVTYSTEVSRNS